MKKDNLEYTERAISNLLFSGTHSLDNGDWKIEWKLSPTRSSIQDKDARTTSFQLTDDGGYRVPTNTRPTRIWRDLNEINVVSKIDITNKLSLFDNDALFKFGLFVFKKRDYTYTVHRLQPSHRKCQNYFSGKYLVPY